MFGIELVDIKSQSLEFRKCETCNSFRNEVSSLHEILGKFTKGEENLDFILFNQGASCDKNELQYQPNKLLINIFHEKKKSNRLIYICNHCYKHDYLKSFCFSKMYNFKMV